MEEAFQMISVGQSPFHIRALLESQFCPSTCLAIIDHLTCRHRYREKFEEPAKWLFTRTAAEQASDSRIARWRAQLLAAEQPGGSLQELGCGIGGDTVFLSRRFKMTAYEQDPARALLAQANLESLGTARQGRVLHQTVSCQSLEGELLFVDPARRESGRISSPQEWLPPLSEVLACYTQKRFHTVAVKCAPGLKAREIDELPPGTRCYFLSVDGQLKEAFLLLDQGQSASLSLAVMFEGQSEPVVLGSQNLSIPLTSPQAGQYLHNPNPAILRARALDSLAQLLQSSLLHPKIGYLVGPSPAQAHYAQSFLIQDHFPLSWSVLKKKLSRTPWTEYEYLGRGVPFSQLEVRQKLPKLKSKGKNKSQGGCVIIYRDEEGYGVILAERKTPPPKGKSLPREKQSP